MLDSFGSLLNPSLARKGTIFVVDFDSFCSRLFPRASIGLRDGFQSNNHEGSNIHHDVLFFSMGFFLLHLMMVELESSEPF